MPVDGPIDVAIVPHTHWDREWYLPFQTYRVRLVRMLDELLPALAGDPSYRRFLLDGQTVAIDDYLDVRPEMATTIAALVADGRLAIGPWAVLMDEFMVSAETIVRNLQRGFHRAAELGASMPIGYLPDMFGHVAQMPQILGQAGLKHAVVWRGVPSAVDRTAFWWSAPDGSRVRAEFLYGSYANAAVIPNDPAGLCSLAESYIEELGSYRLPGAGVLLMHGGDHRAPFTGLGAVVAEANTTQARFRFRLCGLDEYLPTQPVDSLPLWSGELRSGHATNLLMGVASNRVDVHQLAARAERTLERAAEPLAALFIPHENGPGRLLDRAWDGLVLNSAHDSSCACSIDETVDQVVVRYRETVQIADALTAEAMRWLASEVRASPGSVVVANPTARTRSGVIELVVPVPPSEPTPGGLDDHALGGLGTGVLVQCIGETAPEEVLSQIVVGRKIRWFVHMLDSFGLAGEPVAHVEDRGREVIFHLAGPGEPPLDLVPWKERLLARAGDDGVLHIRSIRPGRRTLAVALADVPGFGWRTLEPATFVAFTTMSNTAAAAPGECGGAVTPLVSVPPPPVSVPEPAWGSEGRIGNGLVTVAAGSDGTFEVVTVDGLRVGGLGRLVDSGDGGDTYTWSPPDDDLVVEAPEKMSAEVLERGPVRARLAISATYRWPTHALGDDRRCSARSVETTTVVIDTIVEVRVGEPFVRVEHRFDNTCRDHRLRAHFPFPARVSGSSAECAFTVVERGLEAEGGPHETAVPTFPSRRFVSCSNGVVGLSLVHDGLLEYEVLGEGTELALTLLRATGYLSRREPQTRPNPAGPALAVAGAQVLGPRVARYAVVLHSGTWQTVDLYDIADRVLVPLATAVVGGTFSRRDPVGRALHVDGAEVSALYRGDDGRLVLRLFNSTGATTPVTLDRSGSVVDLLGTELGRFAGSITIGPHGFTTLVCDRPGGDHATVDGAA